MKRYWLPACTLLLACVAHVQPAAAQSQPAAAQSQPACQWLTEGTAATLLGGPATTQSARFLPSGEDSCTFSLVQDQTSSLLEVVLGPSARNPCPPSSPALRGIGNEALLCRPDPTATRTRISSRVRSTYFTVTLTLLGQNAKAISLAKQNDLVERAAEQVAGNLN